MSMAIPATRAMDPGKAKLGKKRSVKMRERAVTKNAMAPLTLPNWEAIAIAGKSVNRYRIGVAMFCSAPKKSTGKAFDAVLRGPSAKMTNAPQAAPSMGAIHRRGDSMPKMSVGRNNNHGFKIPVEKNKGAPSPKIKPAERPNAIDVISPRLVLPRMKSNRNGLTPSLKTASAI